MNNDLEGKRGVGFENSKAESTEYMNDENSKPGKTKIIAIGINQYQHREYWPDLKYPVNDCHKLLDVLRQKYNPGNFLIRELYNDNASALSVYSELRILTEKRENETIEENDNIIIIYSGHGFHSKLGFGCWVGWDAGDPKTDSTLKYNMITLDEIVQFLQNIKAKNILLIVDACHGEKFADRTISLPAIHIPKSGKLDVNPTRYILTSGRKGAVPDESLFMKYLVELLQNNTKSELSVGALEIAISEKIGRGKTYLPFSKNLVPNEHDGGKFYFRISDKYFFKTEETTVLTTLERILVQLRSGSQKYRELLYSGRFRYVRIEDVLLPITDYLPVTELSLEINKETKSVQETLEYLWKESDSHALILGDGGMGKTMSVLRLWEILLDRIENPVPIYVALNEYNLAKPEERTDFVARYIAKHYLGLSLVSQEQTDKIWDFFKTEKAKDKKRTPSVVILLDGLNEVTADRTSLNSELFRVSTEATNVQFVVTSRSGAVENFAWAQGFHQTKLLPLEKEVIIRHLLKNNREIPKEKEVYQLLGNPMMLTIYSYTEQQSEAFRTDSRFNFKFPVNKEAELLWNFREAQLVKLHESLGNQPTSKSQEEKDFQAFLLKYVVPYFAWRMEKAGQFFITDRITVNNQFNFDLLIYDALHCLNKKAITQEVEAFWTYLNGIAPTNSVSDSIRRTRKIREYLVENLHILVLEGDELRFLHQNFRDFYAACHLLNCIKFSLAEDERPEEWQERIFPSYLRKMIGELESEYLFDPYLILESRNDNPPERIKENWLTKLTEQCRGPVDMTGNSTVWNLITILYETRKTLAGAELHALDFQGINLNNCSLSVCKKGKYLVPTLSNSRISGNRFFFPNLPGEIKSAFYHPNDHKIMVLGKNGHFGEYLQNTGEYKNLMSGVLSVSFGPKNHQLILVTQDGTIRDWSTKENSGVDILNGKYKSAEYNPRNNRILAVSRDGKLVEYLTRTGAVMKHSIHGVTFAMFSPNGKLILIIGEKTVLISTDTWEVIKGFPSSYKFGSFSSNGNRIAFFTTSRTIQIFELNKNKFQRSILGSYISVVFSNDSMKLLTVSLAGDIEEWNVKYEICINSIRGEFVSAIYSKDDKIALCTDREGFVQEIHLKSKQAISKLSFHIPWFTLVSSNSKMNRIITATNLGVLTEWSRKYKICVNDLPANGERLIVIRNSPKADRMLTVSLEGFLRERCLKNGTTYKFYGRYISAVYSEDGDKILTVSNGGKIHEWDSERKLKLLGKGSRFASYSPDNQKILSIVRSGKSILIYDIDSWKIEKTINFKNRFIEASFSADGEKILSVSSNCEVRIWSFRERRFTKVFQTPAISAHFNFKGDCVILLTHDFILSERRIDDESVVWESKANPGLFVQGLDLRNLHPDSEFTEEEKERMRRYGAIFDDQDKANWDAAIKDAYGDMEE
jgi:WD40 repeat protein